MLLMYGLSYDPALTRNTKERASVCQSDQVGNRPPRVTSHTILTRTTCSTTKLNRKTEWSLVVVRTCSRPTPKNIPVFFRRTQSRCGQNRYRYHIWCMRVLVEPTFFWAFPEVWTCNGLSVYSPGLGCLCRPLTTLNLRIRHAQTWGGLLLPFVRLYVWPTTVISLYGGKECHFSMTASCA